MTDTGIVRHTNHGDVDLYYRANGQVIGYRTDEDGNQIPLRQRELLAMRDDHH